MKRLSSVSPLILACLVLSCTGMAAPERPSEQSLSPDLDARVTVSRTCIYLGELTEELVRQTRVPLTIEQTKGPLDGVQLNVFVTRKPLREVMGVVADLLTTPHHQCSWEAQKAKGGGYVLRHYPSLEQGAGAGREDLLRRFAADVREAHRLAGGPDEAINAAEQARPDVFPGGLGRRGRLRMLAALNGGDLGYLLSGHFVPLQRGSIGEREKEVLTLGQYPSPPLDSDRPPGFYVKWDTHFIGPALWLTNGSGASPVVGGRPWDHGYLTRGLEGWRDLWAQEVRDQVEGGTRRRIAARTFPDWLEAAAVDPEFQIIADGIYPREREVYSSPQLGITAEQSVYELVFGLIGSPQFRQSGGIWLLRDGSALVHPRRHLLPWKTLKALREATDRNDGLLDPARLAWAANLSRDQQLGLSEEYPTASPEHMEAFRPVLHFAAELTDDARKQLAGKDGLRVMDAGLVARAALTNLADAGPRAVNACLLDYLAKHLDNATRVSLRLEKREATARTRPPGDPASAAVSKTVEVQELVWRVIVPGMPEQLNRLPVQPRKRIEDLPLKPGTKPGADSPAGAGPTPAGTAPPPCTFPELWP
jgi:hypothetical protein